MDFDALNDDQLVALVSGAVAEAMKRQTCIAQVEAVVMAEADRLRIAREAAAQEAQRLLRREAQEVADRAAETVRVSTAAAQQSVLWAKKKAAALAFLAIATGEDLESLTIHVWKGSGKEQRVYIGRGFNENLIVCYVTGNSRVVPGTTNVSKQIGGDREAIKDYCLKLAKEWLELKFFIGNAVAWEGEAATW